MIKLIFENLAEELREGQVNPELVNTALLQLQQPDCAVYDAIMGMVAFKVPTNFDAIRSLEEITVTTASISDMLTSLQGGEVSFERLADDCATLCAAIDFRNERRLAA